MQLPDLHVGDLPRQKPRQRFSHVWPKIDQVISHFSIVLEAASMCDTGIKGTHCLGSDELVYKKRL